MKKWELIVVWETSETDIYEYHTEEEAKAAGRGMRSALGNQIVWYGVREARTTTEATTSTTRPEMVASLFRSVVPTYTGGGIYVFCGELTNGNYFMADNSWHDVRILNGDPTEPTGESYLDIPELNWESVEWQEEHLVEDLTPGDARTFFREMLEWILYKKPYGNYQVGDMEDLLEDLEPKYEY